MSSNWPLFRVEMWTSRLSWLFSAFFLSTFSLWGQSASAALTIKVFPFEWVSPINQSVTIYSDIPLHRRWSLDAGIGAILHSSGFAEFKGETYQGVRLRTGIRRYLSQDQDGNTAIGLAVKSHVVHNDQYVNVFRQGNQYAEWMLRRRTIHMLAGDIYFSTQLFLGKKDRFFIELFGGGGLRYFQVTRSALPPDVGEQITGFRLFTLELSPGTHWLPDMMAGIYIGYRFGRR